MMPMSSKTVFPYPGGKSRAASLIMSYFPPVDVIASPFMGGGSVEILAASRGVSVHAYDSFRPLVDFWRCVEESPDDLADIIAENLPLEKKTFFELRARDPMTFDRWNRAAVFWLLQTHSFSGFGYSGAYTDSKKPTQAAVDAVRNFNAPNLDVAEHDCFETLRYTPDDTFIYADPPYDIDRPLYGVMGSHHRGFDHERFARAIQEKENWIVSYGDTPMIRRLFDGFRILEPKWIYSIRSDRGACLPSNELLIISDAVWEAHERNSLLAYCK